MRGVLSWLVSICCHLLCGSLVSLDGGGVNVLSSKKVVHELKAPFLGHGIQGRLMFYDGYCVKREPGKRPCSGKCLGRLFVCASIGSGVEPEARGVPWKCAPIHLILVSQVLILASQVDHFCAEVVTKVVLGGKQRKVQVS